MAKSPDQSPTESLKVDAHRYSPPNQTDLSKTEIKEKTLFEKRKWKPLEVHSIKAVQKT